MSTTLLSFKRLQTSGWLTLVSLAAACSLTVPSEDELFGGDAEQGGGSGGKSNSGGSGGSGGTDDFGSAGLAGQAGEGDGGEGSPSGGTGATGAGGKSSGTGGKGSGGNTTTSGGTAGADGGAAGAGAVAGDAGAGGSSEPLELPPAVLAIHYDFEDITGGVVTDLTENEQDGQLLGTTTPTVAAGHLGNALVLNGAQKQYVKLPNDVLVDKPFVSVAIWFKLTSRQFWDRLFDFNTAPPNPTENSTNWFYFSPSGWNEVTKTFGSRCASLSTAGLAEFVLDTSVPTSPITTWHHVTVVFGQPFLRYYLDGVPQGELVNLRFGPDAVGETDQNTIGRSGYPTDPYINAQVDDFRLYSGVLTPTEIQELAAQ